MLASVNGVAIVGLRLTLPREGVWTGELSAQSDEPLDFKLSIQLGGLPFRATARTSSMVAGTAVAEFVGGAAGFSLPIKAKAYNSVPFNIPFQDILGAAGEKVSGHCARELLQLQLNAWSIAAGKSGQALNSLVRLAPSSAGLHGVVWRTQPDGTVWAGVEAWDPVDIEYEVINEDPMANRVVLFMEHPGLLPGTVLGGRRVDHVEHSIKDSKLRTAVWFE